MPVSEVLRALRRRWPVVLVGLLVTAGLTSLVPRVVPVTYEARALMVLLPPSTLEGTGGNPYLALGGLESVVGVLSRSLVTDDTMRKVEAVSPGVKYDVSGDDSVSGPVMLITVLGRSRQGALDAVQVLLDTAPGRLQDLQADSGVRDSAVITTAVVSQDDRATPQRKKQIRTLIAVGGAGLAATILGVAWLDGVLRRRAARRRRTKAEAAWTGSDDPPGEPPPPDGWASRRGRSASAAEPAVPVKAPDASAPANGGTEPRGLTTRGAVGRKPAAPRNRTS